MKLIKALYLAGIIIGTTPINAESFAVQKELKNNQISYHIDMDKDEKVLIQDDDLILTINQINDHSCPKYARCLWEGGFEVEVEILEGFEMEKLVFMYNENTRNNVLLADREIEVLDVYKEQDRYHVIIQIKNNR